MHFDILVLPAVSHQKLTENGVLANLQFHMDKLRFCLRESVCLTLPVDSNPKLTRKQDGVLADSTDKTECLPIYKLARGRPLSLK